MGRLMRMYSAGNRRGLSRVDVVVAIGVLGIAVSILLGIITPLLGSLAKAQETDKAIDARAHVRRYVKAMPYESLVEGTEAQQVVVFNCEGFEVCLKRSALYDP